MPIQTRCPSCSAAVPSSAAWCSLCHADLRDPAEATSVDLSDGSSAAEHVAEMSDAELIQTEPVGRHAAHVPAAPERPRSSGAMTGRHAASRGRSVARPSVRGAAPVSGGAVLDGIELPSGGDVTPEQVDALAEQMLTRLAVTEARPTVLDLDDVPGGKWGFAAAVMTAVIVVLLAVGTIAGLVLNR